MEKHKTIFVAPLHWGLGHATRCIPIIDALLAQNFNVIMGSDGAALGLLRKEFPQLKTIELPSYNIRYSKRGTLLSATMAMQLPHIKQTMVSEEKIVAQLVSEGIIDGIISDNRFGVHNKDIPSVYITHQLKVFSGITTKLSTKFHRNIIEKFDECWVPDMAGNQNLSGMLSHPSHIKIPTKYLGIMSRMRKQEIPTRYDYCVILSGPEPQRTELEKIIISELKTSTKSILLVQGKIESKEKTKTIGAITVCNFLQTEALESAINSSEVIISRSGYTTIMDLAVLEKKAFFIPTPGQKEQQYLAEKMQNDGIAPYCKQSQFSIKKLEDVQHFSGFAQPVYTPNYNELFRLFEGE